MAVEAEVELDAEAVGDDGAEVEAVEVVEVVDATPDDADAPEEA
jgi:hypothetical protein